MRTLAAKADEETRPSNPNLRAVPPPVQPLLPEARAFKPSTPFVKRLAFVRTCHPDAKCLLLVLGSWCEVYTDGAAGRCWPKRETVRELCEMGAHRFRRAWNLLAESGALTVRRRGQGLSSMLTVNAVPLSERTPGRPIKNAPPVDPSRTVPTHQERTPGRPIKNVPPVDPRSDQRSDQQAAAAAAAAVDRYRCKPCRRSWPASYGPDCSTCGADCAPKPEQTARTLDPRVVCPVCHANVMPNKVRFNGCPSCEYGAAVRGGA